MTAVLGVMWQMPYSQWGDSYTTGRYRDSTIYPEKVSRSGTVLRSDGQACRLEGQVSR